MAYLSVRDEQGRIHLLEIKVPLGYSESPSSSAVSLYPDISIK